MGSTLILGLAEVDSAGEKPEKAERKCRAALKIFQETKSETEIGHAYLGIAEARRLQRSLEIEFYEKAESIYSKRKMWHCRVMQSYIAYWQIISVYD